MRFDAHFGEAEAVQLKAAILLYGGAKRIAFASVHEPYHDPGGGAPYLDAGRPISTEFLRTLARGLGLGMAPEILPESVVMRTPEVTGWWVPAAVRPMFFPETSDGKTLNGKTYPHPPLLFVVDGEHGLSVRALMENRRPEPGSAIRRLSASVVRIGQDAVITHPPLVMPDRSASQPSVVLCAKTTHPTPSSTKARRPSRKATPIRDSKKALSLDFPLKDFVSS